MYMRSLTSHIYNIIHNMRTPIEAHFLGPQNFGKSDMQKSLLGFLFPADTRHVLKICKDPFRGVDEIGWEKQSHKATPYGGAQ